MDQPRKTAKRRHGLRRATWIVGTVTIIAAVSVGLSRLKPAAPTVERDALYIGTVERGPMIREARGTGVLVPEVTWWVPATSTGRVERIAVLPGTSVEPKSTLLELSNPQLRLDVLDAEWRAEAAQAELESLGAMLQSERLGLEVSVTHVEADLQEAQLQLEIHRALSADGLTSGYDLETSQLQVTKHEKVWETERRRLEIHADSVQARLASQRTRVEQARALLTLKREQLDRLTVRAGRPGVLEQMLVQVGEQVAAGTVLAKVTDPTSLKAVLRIPETQAREIRIGQGVTIDTRAVISPGRVTRIDPAVQNGTVAVDVSFDGPLPEGARPDLSVVGTIEIERLDDVLHVGRPASGGSNDTIGLFKLDADGATAERVPVTLGRSSVTTVEIEAGLHVSDRVVLSDTSRWDEFDRIRLE
jgi:HlyD family secretion protein